MTNRSSGIGAQLQHLKEQMEALSGSVAPSLTPGLAKLAGDAAPPLHKLLGYLDLAAKVAPQVGKLVTHFVGGAERAVAARAPLPPARRPRRHRVLLGGLVVGAGLVAYGLYSGHLVALARKYAPKS